MKLEKTCIQGELHVPDVMGEIKCLRENQLYKDIKFSQEYEKGWLNSDFSSFLDPKAMQNDNKAEQVIIKIRIKMVRTIWAILSRVHSIKILER